MPRLIFFILLCLVGLNSCTSKTEEHGVHYESIELLEPPSDLKIPIVIWELLEEKKTIDVMGKLQPPSQPYDKYEENVFVGITVRMQEKTPGILGGRNLELKAPRQGMILDLAQYIKKDKGTFIFSFQPDYKWGAKPQVLFLSRSQERVVQGQKLGSGCHSYFDMSRSYFSHFEKKGIEVNVTEGRHVSLLAGTFFLRVDHQTGVRQLSQLTIVDSRFPDLMCGSIESVEEK